MKPFAAFSNGASPSVNRSPYGLWLSRAGYVERSVSLIYRKVATDLGLKAE
jgi:hypothetical protein